MRFTRHTGFTLVEIIVTIVVLAVAATAILGVFSSTVRSSANPMIQQQAVSIAEAYMEEILLKPFDDPDGVDGETTRITFDDVDDYDGLLPTDVADQNGVAIPGLAAYTVTVVVSGVTLNGTAPALQVVVTVNHNVLGSIVLQGYRTNY